MRHLPAHHHARKRGRRFLFGVAGARHLAVAQHGGAVADALHLFQTVADVEDGAALGAQLEKRFEETVGLLRRQHRSRLVEDDEPGVLQEGADDLDALALADREIGHMGIGVERQAVGMGEFGGAGRDIGERHGVVQRQRDVFGDRQRLEQGKVLEDHADAELARSAWTCDPHRLALPADLAARRRQNAEQHLDEGRLARTVFAQQGVDFTGADIEIDAVAGGE